ncbi:MAG: alpha,alpha-trehalase TreF [Saprospiraceae bacterium]
MNRYAAPDAVFPGFFEAVQMSGIFPDSKTFVDSTPKAPPAEILAKYQARKDAPGFDLKSFVDENFAPPGSHASGYVSDPGRTAQEHIGALWPVLTRQADTAVPGSSLLPLPHPYIVPGGRFGEIYYWDSYFTMLGLHVAGRADMIASMLDNFSHLIDTFGFIPNGNRTYFLSRSQPPFFSLMVRLLMEEKGEDILAKYLPQLEREYTFWMDGSENLPSQTTHRRVVKLPDGTALNRYFDDNPAPRQESYREDVELAGETNRPPRELYRNLRAACESGWDFSTRWFRDGTTLATIRTTELLPVDLNALLYHLEHMIARGYALANDEKAFDEYRQKAERRKAAIQRYCWDEASGYFTDYDFVAGEKTDAPSLATVFPLFFHLASPKQAVRVAQNIEKHFLKAGGLVTTLCHSGQQWDAPNGWAPLQWMAIRGLRNYGHDNLAIEIKNRWVALNTKVYKNTGKMVEKYNVEDMDLLAGGGEYPVQDGFGWSNGVLLRLLSEG